MPKKVKEEKVVKNQTVDQDKKWLMKEQEYFKESEKARSSNVEKQWMINDAMYRGYHNIKWNQVRNTVEFDTSDPMGLYVNLVKSTVRAVRNAVTRQRPEWDVDAIPYSELDPEQKRVLGYYLSWLYEKMGMRKTLKEGILYGLIYGLGVFQYGYDSKAEDGTGSLWIDTFNTFDIYPDPLATSVQDCRYIDKVIRKSKEEVQSNPNYKNTEKIGATDKTSESPYKQQLNSKIQNAEGSNAVLLHEMWVRDGEKIRVVTTCNNILLRNEIVEGYDDLPFVFYQPEIQPNELYSEGWVKDLVTLNKAINFNERNILEYIFLMVRGRYVKDKNAKLSVINNQNGQIISKTRGSEFTQLPMQPLPATPFNQISNLRSYINDIGSAPEALRGMAPTGITAARALEDLVANAYNSLSDPIDNMIDALQELGEAMLRLLYKFQDVRKDFKVKINGQEETFSIVGANGEVGEMEMGQVIKVPKNPQVKVSITSGVAYTKGAKEESMLRLYGAGIVDRRTVQESFDLNSEEIEQRLMEQNMPPEAQMQEAPQGAVAGQGTPIEEIVPIEIYEQLSDAGKALVEEFADNGLRFSEEFISNPQLIEDLAAGALEYHVMEDGLVMASPEEGMRENIQVGQMG